MDAVVISVILSIAGTVLVIGYLAYRFFRIIGGKDENEEE